MDFRQYDTRLAAYALIVDADERVLLALWNEGPTPQWTLPGGGVELHETTAEAAVRELREESGYDVELGQVLGVDSYVIDPDRGHARLTDLERQVKSVRVVYEGRVVGGTLTNEVDGSTEEARWVPLADVSALDRVWLVDAALAFWRDRRAR